MASDIYESCRKTSYARRMKLDTQEAFFDHQTSLVKQSAEARVSLAIEESPMALNLAMEDCSYDGTRLYGYSINK